MKRIHLFEFNDLSWFPERFRNHVTNYLQFVSNTFDIYKCVIPALEKGIKSSGNNTIIDIASGGGGGLIKISKRLKQNIQHLKIILSDYYPNIQAFKKTKAKSPGVFEYVEGSVNAMDIPSHLKGFRTQFLSFHHFKPKDAKAILQNAIDNYQPIGIFEAQQRDTKNFFQRLLSPISVLLLTPFLRSLSFELIIFTYLIPVLPLVTLWDGVVSVLRTYTIKELKQMISELRNSAGFDWEISVAKGTSNDILYLLGVPCEK